MSPPSESNEPLKEPAVAQAPTTSHHWLDRYFKITERGSSIRTELLGGATTFLTMAYIIVVNPAILSFAGIPTGPSTVATILTAVFGSLFMGLFANRPLAVAPYMGENAFIASVWQRWESAGSNDSEQCF